MTRRHIQNSTMETLYHDDVRRPHEMSASRIEIAGTSKHAKKRAKEKEKEQEARSLASRVGRQGEIRVLSSGRAQEDASGRREGKSFSLPLDGGLLLLRRTTA